MAMQSSLAPGAPEAGSFDPIVVAGELQEAGLSQRSSKGVSGALYKAIRGLATKKDVDQAVERMAAQLRTELEMSATKHNARMDTLAAEFRGELEKWVGRLRGEQESSTDKLRSELRASTEILRAEQKASTDKLRSEQEKATDKLRNEQRTSTEILRSEQEKATDKLRNEIALSRAETKEAVADLKADLMQRMLWFMVTIVGMVVALGSALAGLIWTMLGAALG